MIRLTTSTGHSLFNMINHKFSEYITIDMAKHYGVFGGSYVNKDDFRIDDKSQ